MCEWGNTSVRSRCSSAPLRQPERPGQHAGSGDALLWSGEAEGRSGRLKPRVPSTRGCPRGLFGLGAAYFLVGKSADAVRTFERITTCKEGNPFIYAMLAAIYAENGRDDDSRSAAAEVRKLNAFFDVARFGSLFRKPEHRDRLANALIKDRT